MARQKKPPMQTISPVGAPSEEAAGTPRVSTFVRFNCIRMDQPTDGEGSWTVSLVDDHDVPVARQLEGHDLRRMINSLLDEFLGRP